MNQQQVNSKKRILFFAEEALILSIMIAMLYLL